MPNFLQLKVIVMVLATMCERFANVATPPDAVAVKVPCNVPEPALRAAVMTVELSSVIKLPKVSSMRTIGCCANAIPAVAWKKVAAGS